MMELNNFCRMLFRLLFVIFNVIAAFMGFIIMILGIVSVASSRYLYIADSGWYGVPVFLIIMGLVLMGFSVFGIIGAGFDIKCILFFYSLGLVACIVLIAITCIAGFIWKDALDGGIRDALKTNVDDKVEYNVIVDEIQEVEGCCGVNNFTDWYNTPWAKNKTTNGKAVPQSCCIDVDDCNHGINGSALNENDIHKEGCYGKLASYVDEYYYGFIIIILLFCFFLALGEIVTWYLLCTGASKKNNKYETV